MISIRNMYKTYSSKHTGSQKVFEDFSVNFPSKGFVSILGKSGCGKTTLLNIIGGIDSIDKGSVNVFGYDISRYSNGNGLIDEYRKDIVGFVFQNYNLINNINVYRNLAIPLEMQGYTDSEIEKKISDVLSKVEMSEYSKRMPYELSGGQQQRIAIARALIKESRVILADEPTGNLDSTTANEILKLLKDISKDRLVIFITHDQEYADAYSNNIIKIQDGKIVNDYECNYDEENNSIVEVKSKIGLLSIMKNGLENLRLSLLKNMLVVLLFSVTIAIISSSVVILTTSENEMLVDVIQSNEDEFSTRIVSAQITTTDSGDEVLSQNSDRENLYEIYSTYLEIQEKHGTDNIILSTKIHLLNSYTLEGPLFDNDILLTTLRMNLLDSSVEYELPHLQGRMPENAEEVVISDMLSYLLFGREDGFGETVEFNRFRGSDTISDAELTVVGIIQTDYLEKGFLDDELLYEKYSYSGNASIATHTYSFREESVYAQLYGYMEIFDDMNDYYNYPNRDFIPFQISTESHYDQIAGTILNKRYVDNDSLLGRLPENEFEIAVSKDQLPRLFPDNEAAIDDLNMGIISWDEFYTIVDFSEVNIYYNSQVNENHYGDIFPETMTLVGAYDPILDTMSFSESYVLEESLIIRLNNAYPYDDAYLSVINQSVKLEEFVEEVTSEDFNSMFLNFVPFYDREVFINTEGSFNLFKAVVTIENSVVPTTKTILTGSILFTFVLMFLFSYLSVLNNQKRIGIFRSLGYRRFDILKMFIVENGVVLLVSLLIGGIACLLLLSNLNSIIFSETIFTELMLYRFDTTSLLVSILVIASLMIVTSAFPLYRVLKLTPINIINRD